jgi:adenylate kinase
VSSGTKNTNILFFGPQGVGKGTQAAIVAPVLQLAHVSTGDLFRRNIAEKTPLGVRVEEILASGALVPDDVTIAMLSEHLLTLRETEPELRGIIFDGFPRTVTQAESLDDFLRTRGERVDAVVYIDAPREVLIERMLSRGRADDTREAIQTRLDRYAENTEPLLSLYEQRGLLHRANGHQRIDAVTSEIVSALSPLFEGGQD